jgi:hypothetical protein
MNRASSIFGQILQSAPRPLFERAVRVYAVRAETRRYSSITSVPLDSDLNCDELMQVSNTDLRV